MNDMTMACGDGFVTIRVGAVILRDGKILLSGNPGNTYLYSVGGRMQIGETAEDAIRREVLEETGVAMEVDRLGFIHEAYYPSDNVSRTGKLTYEICFYFFMKLPENFSPVCRSRTEDDNPEYLTWVSPEDPRDIYPPFFRTALFSPDQGIKHFVDDFRNGTTSLGG